jgi:prepilin-type N-terminal cleavage/methylation domain-containing protein
MKAHQPVSGFTIIELLVVMAIIALLAALLFPVFSTVQLHSREASATGNLEQIAIALKAYEKDNNAYPVAPYFDGTRFQGGVSALYPNYLTDKSLLLCPDDPLVLGGANTSPVVYSSYNGIVVDPSTWAFQTDANGPERLYNYYGYDNDGYDTYSQSTFTSPYPAPAWLTSQGLTGRFYPRLMSRYAPGNTIITRAPYFRGAYGTNPAQQMDLVLRLNGKTEKVNVAPMATPDATYTPPVSPWVMQK